ncbi:MAG TPA: SigE family RNA polymerase sigma factor, partial [Nocardioidaceae bacterium]
SAEDLLQTTLATVYVRWSRIRDRRAADAYMRRAMVNQQISWFRQKWRTCERPTDDLPERPHDWDHDSHHRWDRGELWPFVTALPARQRAVVVLRYYEDLSEAETARVLGCSIGTVKSQTNSGLAKLRRMARESGLGTAGVPGAGEAEARLG